MVRPGAPFERGHERAAERLKVVMRTGNMLDHREIEVHDAELRLRDRSGQVYRLDVNRPELLRRLVRSAVAEPLPGAAMRNDAPATGFGAYDRAT